MTVLPQILIKEGKMIILITGASHTGKTNLAQKLLEKYKYPYLSIDHLKMGLIRSGQTSLVILLAKFVLVTITYYGFVSYLCGFCQVLQESVIGFNAHHPLGIF